jgi:prepilin-type N-terminal cleavage/methylation domain-containing protein
MFRRTSYTLIEILVVIVIIATLAALTWPNYKRIKEKYLNQEAKASLQLIRAAEKIYRMEQGFYYPYDAIESSAANINSFLKLSLPVSASINWSISLNGNNPPNEHGLATRTGTGASDSRVWSIDFPGDVDPTCTGGSGTPSTCM